MMCSCGFKMKCNYSVPVNRRQVVRYRTYRCDTCGKEGRRQSVEMPLEWLDYDPEYLAEVIKKIKKAVALAKVKRGAISKWQTDKKRAPA